MVVSILSTSRLSSATSNLSLNIFFSRESMVEIKKVIYQLCIPVEAKKIVVRQEIGRIPWRELRLIKWQVELGRIARKIGEEMARKYGKVLGEVRFRIEGEGLPRKKSLFKRGVVSKKYLVVSVYLLEPEYHIRLSRS